jgi:hypothetical protein
MRTFRNFIIFVILVVIAFGAGYGLGYWKLQSAEKEWASARGEMQSKIGNLEKELAKARTRETLREMSDILSQVVADLSEKNFGLAGKHLDRVKEAFAAVQPSLPPEMRNELDFLPAAIEETRKEAQNLSPEAQKKAEEMKSRFDQSLSPGKKG